MTDYVLRSDIADAIDYQIELSEGEWLFVNRAIEGIQAADVVPVRHAHWMSWEDMVKAPIKPKSGMPGVFCSACVAHSDMPRNYCPECGAKMDELCDRKTSGGQNAPELRDY